MREPIEIKVLCPNCGKVHPEPDYMKTRLQNTECAMRFCLRAQLATAKKELADWHDHIDHAPHEDCDCWFCEKCRQLAAVTAERNVLKASIMDLKASIMDLEEAAVLDDELLALIRTEREVFRRALEQRIREADSLVLENRPLKAEVARLRAIVDAVKAERAAKVTQMAGSLEAHLAACRATDDALAALDAKE